MENIEKIDELSKSENYLKIISTPDSPNGPDEMSRFVEYSATNKAGWKIIEMQPVDVDGNPKGKALDVKKFIISNEENFNSIKTAITAALGAMGNQGWIDAYEFPSNKAYAIVYLGRLCLQIGSHYYTPIFEYPGSNKKGDSFWISATVNKGENGEINYSARTVVIYPDDISNAQLQHAGLAQLNASRMKRWNDENEERRKNGDPLLKNMPRTITEREFFPSLEIVREVGEKTFFIVYRSGIQEKDVANFAKSAITGETFRTELARKGVTEGGSARERAAHGRFLDLDPKDDRLLIFKYYNGDNKNPNLQPGWNLLQLVKGSIFKPGSYTQEHRDVSVKFVNKPTTFTVRIKVGDKLKIPRIAKGSEKLDTRVTYTEAEVIKTENIPVNKKRIAVKVTEE